MTDTTKAAEKDAPDTTKASDTKDEKAPASLADAAALDPEVQKAMLAKTSASSGTASGVAVREADRDDIPQGADRGNTNPIETEGGLREEAAIITPNGSLGGQLVGSPSGPVPVAALTTDPEQAAKLLRARNKSLEDFHRTREINELDEEFLSRMSAAEIRAVAHDRGYDLMIRGGRRATAREFLTFQAEDKNVTKKGAAKPSSTAASTPLPKK